MTRIFIFLTFCMSLSFSGKASHVMGGDITWTCQGGNFVFQLVFYRDCNGAEINTISETIDVWGHPDVSSIQLNFESRTDISPICTEVAGGPTSLQCGSGASGGNGIGAIERIIYRSAPTALNGTPPASGWIFTYENFSRSGAITNLSNPSNTGITLVSKMFEIPNSTGGCIDNSPQFLQDPYFVSCAGDPYEYNMNTVDPDLDSIYISFSHPLNNFTAPTYDPPNNPIQLPFEPGFSTNSPTPGTSLNPGNIPATIDPSSGKLTFQSFTIGNFAVKITVQSFRGGVLISEIDREMQIAVSACSGTNTAPTIAGPFGGSFETTVNAGDLVNFQLTSSDLELLQDGSQQSNILSATGLLFGANSTSPTGCAIEPCATLNTLPPITMIQGSSADFSWQTSCEHLERVDGSVANSIPYHFVFKVQDDYCPIPKVSYATVTINVELNSIIPAPEIECIQSDATGNVTVNWTQATDPDGTFVAYEVHSVQDGLISTINTIGTPSVTLPNPGQQTDYFVTTLSGCNGNISNSSDTLSNIHLNLNNPSNGTAVLQWNDPISTPTSSMGAYYHIYREYPTGTWTLLDSVPYGTTFYIDTIDICNPFLNYQIVLPNSPCDYTSAILGDTFEDMLTPDIPVIDFVSIDTLTNNVNLSWNQNAQEDTYGYVIYTADANGFIVELDTVWGITNTTYTHITTTDGEPLTYSVAAFDSCFTSSTPPTYQTSAKAPVHTTNFLQANLDICTRTVSLNWTGYEGWNNLEEYEIFIKLDGVGSWTSIGTSNINSFSTTVIDGKNYCFLVRATSTTGVESFSNSVCLFVSTPNQPSFNYLQVATVNGDRINLRYTGDPTVGSTEISIQKEDFSGTFNEIARLPFTSGTIAYTDTDVDVVDQSYTYRVQVIDSCNQLGAISNYARTILLKIQSDDVAKLNYVSWNSYLEFDGSILGYNLYRGIDGQFDSSPIATLGVHQTSYEDDVNSIVSTGKICYYVEAIESMNTYGFSEISKSNIQCATLPPLIYIPNAFRPDGINKIFIPVISDFDPTNYSMTIFNRWGHVIFETNLHDEGWDGIIPTSGKMAQTGTYLYLVKVTDANGIEVVKRGHVTLLK